MTLITVYRRMQFCLRNELYGHSYKTYINENPNLTLNTNRYTIEMLAVGYVF